MSELGRGFLPPDVRRLIDLDRRSPDPPEDARRDVAARLDRALHLGGALLGPIGVHGVDLGAGPASAPPGRAARLGAWKLVTGAAISAAVAAGALAGLSMRSRHREVVHSGADSVVWDEPEDRGAAGERASVDRPSAARGSDLDRGAPPSPSVALGERRPRAEGSARAALRAAVRAEPRDTLSAERILLDAARAALAHHDATSALAVLKSHERAFLRGQLREERESMRVQALALAGDVDAARLASARFRRQFPRSIFASAIEQVAPLPSREPASR